MFKKSFRIAVLVLLLKALGFVKQLIIARYYGASSFLDMYSLAYTVVNQPGAIVAEALLLVVVSKYPIILEKKGKKRASIFVSSLLEWVIIIFSFIACLLVAFSGILSRVLSQGKPHIIPNILIVLIIIEAPYVVLITMVHVLNSILEVNKSFFVPRMESFVNSIMMILFAVLFYEIAGARALAFADLAYALICLIVAFIYVKRFCDIRFPVPLNVHEAKDFVLLMIPLVVGTATYRINSIIDAYLASSVEGGVAALSYSQVLEQLVTVTMNVSFVSVMFSYTSTYNAQEDSDSVNKTVKKTLRLLLLLVPPLSVLSILHGNDIVTLVYKRGNFMQDAVDLTEGAFVGYAFGFVFVLLKATLDKYLIVNGDLKLISVLGVIAMIINVVLSITLLRLVGVMGITLATSIVMILLTIFMAIYIHAKYFKLLNVNAGVYIFKAVLSNMIAIISLVFIDSNSDICFVRLVINTFVYLTVYFIVGYLFQMYSLRSIKECIKNTKNN